MGLDLPQWIKPKISSSELVLVLLFPGPSCLVAAVVGDGSLHAMAIVSLDFFPQGVDTVRK